MIITIPIASICTDGGIEFITNETNVIRQLTSMKLFTREISISNFKDQCLFSPSCAIRAFEFVNENMGNVVVYCPDDHPAAVMAKLTWGGQ